MPSIRKVKYFPFNAIIRQHRVSTRDMNRIVEMTLNVPSFPFEFLFGHGRGGFSIINVRNAYDFIPAIT